MKWFVGWVQNRDAGSPHFGESRPWLIQSQNIERGKDQLELIKGPVSHIEEVKKP